MFYSKYFIRRKTGKFRYGLSRRIAVIFIDKYSDVYECYCALKFFRVNSICYIYIETDRVTGLSLTEFFKAKFGDSDIQGICVKNKETAAREILQNIEHNKDTDAIVIAPLFRYRPFYMLLRSLPARVVTVHLSEVFTESIGLWNYQLMYRMKGLNDIHKSIIKSVYHYFHRADLCCFPLFPKFENCFAHCTYPMVWPDLTGKKKDLINSLLGEKKRTLIIGGFGLDWPELSRREKCESFVATSKHREIILDGERMVLDDFVSAEDIMFTGKVSQIVSYPSSALSFALCNLPNTPIHCHRARGFEQAYGVGIQFKIPEIFKRLGIKIYDTL